jgi:hypothetical protein
MRVVGFPPVRFGAFTGTTAAPDPAVRQLNNTFQIKLTRVLEIMQKEHPTMGVFWLYKMADPKDLAKIDRTKKFANIFKPDANGMCKITPEGSPNLAFHINMKTWNVTKNSDQAKEPFPYEEFRQLMEIISSSLVAANHGRFN